MLKKPLKIVAPSAVGDDFICSKEEQAAYEHFKGVLHAAAPFVIGVVSVKVALIYFFCVFLLYSTVFRKKSEGFFGAIAIISVLVGGLLIPA